MGIVRQGTAANASPELSALNQLAKCAKVDSVAKERFDREMKRLQETEELPPEYWRRVMLVYKTGMPVSASKGVYRQSGKRLGIVVQKETRQNMSNISPTIGHVASEGVGELDGSGEAKKKFEMLLEQKLFAEAREYLFTFKEKVHDSIFLIYEKYLYAALTTATQSFELWNKTLDINPDDRSVFILALRDLLHKQRVDLAMQLFSERHGGNLKKGRTFGHLLSETGKRSNALPSRAAMAVLADGHPKLAIEILKPTLLNYISSQHQMPPHLLEAFAYCAAVDAEIRQDFLEQMRDYRRYQGVKDDHIHELLAIVYGQEIERQQSIAEAKRLIQRFSFREDEVQYRGRVARSTFFKDPHTMISAASGNERRKQLKRQDTVDAFEGIPEENIVTIARLLLAEKGLDENNLAHTSPDTFSTLLFSPSITGLHIYNRIMKTALNVLLADHIIAFAQILFPESVENNQEVQETIIKPLEESVLKIREMHTVHDFQTAASLLNIEFSPVALNFNESDAGLLQLIEELQRHRETIQSILLHTTDSTVCKAASRLLKISKTL
jgi:tetratricopeptide (TPR) repeat protein